MDKGSMTDMKKTFMQKLKRFWHWLRYEDEYGKLIDSIAFFNNKTKEQENGNNK